MCVYVHPCETVGVWIYICMSLGVYIIYLSICFLNVYACVCSCSCFFFLYNICDMLR